MPAVLGHSHISSANVFCTLRLPHTWLPVKNPQVSGTIGIIYEVPTMLIGHLPITFSRFFKACSGAHPFLWKCLFFHMQLKVIFVRVVVHQASLVSRALVIVQLVNCPFFPLSCFQFCPGVHPQQNEKNSAVKTEITWQVKYLNMKRWKIMKIGGKMPRMDVKEVGLFKKGPLWTEFTRVFRIWSTSYYFVGFWLWRQRLTCIPLSRFKMIFFSILQIFSHLVCQLAGSHWNC